MKFSPPILSCSKENICFHVGDYSFGFGGHENMIECDDSDGMLSFGDFGYNTYLGRRLNIDPLYTEMLWQSPFSVMNNSPIYFKDPTGLTGEPPEDQKVIKTADNSYMNIPSGATVSKFWSTSVFSSNGDLIKVSPDAIRSFTINNNYYEAGFNDKGEFTGYYSQIDGAKYSPSDIIYKDKVSDSFVQKLLEISYNLKQDPNKLMAVFAQETGETFNPQIKSKDGQVGLIQFTGVAITAINNKFGTNYTKSTIVVMTAEAQLDVVQKYFECISKPLNTIEDYALATFSPKNIGKAKNHAIYSKGEDRYEKNKGLDTNGDGAITVSEVGAKYAKKYVKSK